MVLCFVRPCLCFMPHVPDWKKKTLSVNILQAVFSSEMYLEKYININVFCWRNLWCLWCGLFC